MILSVHQPAFMPWYPLFQKINESDLFIFQSHCQYQRRGFQNRFEINGKWHTMSVKKADVKTLISDIEYSDAYMDWKKIKNQLPQYRQKLEYFDHCISDNLAKTNQAIIATICDKLDIDTKISYDYKTSLLSTERLIDLCIKFNADTYLSGLGGKNYMDLNLFSKHGIKVIFQKNLEKKPILEML
jgi:hypothetical protein